MTGVMNGLPNLGIQKPRGLAWEIHGLKDSILVGPMQG